DDSFAPEPPPAAPEASPFDDDELAFAPEPAPAAPAKPAPPAEGEPLAGLLDEFAFLEEPTPAAPAPPPPAAASPEVDDFRAAAPPPLPDDFLVDTPEVAREVAP